MQVVRNMPEHVKHAYCVMGLCGHDGAVRRDSSDNVVTTSWGEMKQQRMAAEQKARADLETA